MLILISNPTSLAEEATLIKQLFDEGLDLFHIRRPHDSEQNVVKLIEALDSRYHPKISLHQHHHLADQYAIKKLHFGEHHRREQGHHMPQLLKDKGYRLSTSVHNIEDFERLNPSFHYSFLGPVFDSISKPGYTASLEGTIPGIRTSTRAIAIGGIEAANVHRLRGHFDGVALLGTIWCSHSPLRNFLQIRKIWNTQDP